MAGASLEHGNSYLALIQYVGVLGVVPFLILLFLVLRLTYRVGCCMWRTEDPHHYAVPLALVCLAGLINAFFEDWLFAVGYYLNVFFWTSAFLLSDLQPRQTSDPKVVGRAWQGRAVVDPQINVSANQ
jgi:hypothetical protein